MLKPIYEERVLGRAQVRQVFKGSSIGTIAGSFVESGTITRNSKVRLLRDGVVMADTVVSSLRRFKDDVREVAQGYECGIGIENFQDIKEGDVLETYEIREIART
jgi:translation initiation factor IF-2